MFEHDWLPRTTLLRGWLQPVMRVVMWVVMLLVLMVLMLMMRLSVVQGGRSRVERVHKMIWKSPMYRQTKAFEWQEQVHRKPTTTMLVLLIESRPGHHSHL